MTHCWDQQGASANGYLFDRTAALDATRRMLELLGHYIELLGQYK